ncbi:uncharacterized protein [Elaeis guineensis]|uniref:Uncharacterized protein LOC105039034 n=1 Tax=Elaeis guineensis var. tenera TaxID=51953 RepID=A0A6I9QPQ9_ELAGV|nr:uncharacterized protein LOC105039034 [Elaeis guineensis]
MSYKEKEAVRVSPNPSSGGKESSVGVNPVNLGRASLKAAPTSVDPLPKGTDGSSPQSTIGKEGARAQETTGTWSQTVQGLRMFKWESLRASADEVAALEVRFTNMVYFSNEDIDKACTRWRSTLVGKFLG